jgi:hydroxymethylbilane synthase
MARNILRIGTRDSQLAIWQATLVQNLLNEKGVSSELIYIKTKGDNNTVTPLYELGVQGIFTKTLDTALLNNRIDVAVHSMKDVPTKLAQGVVQAAVLKRASYKDILVYKGPKELLEELLNLNKNGATHNSQYSNPNSIFTIATSSLRRKAQWLNRYPHHEIENLRGNVNSRLLKLRENNWNGAIFAAAGLERIELRPTNSIDLDWMLPAPTQGAIMIVCRKNDDTIFKACQSLNDTETALCTKIEKDFLRVLMGGCSTPISALVEIKNDKLIFKGNICSVDGKQKINVEKEMQLSDGAVLGEIAAQELLAKADAQQILGEIRNARI